MKEGGILKPALIGGVSLGILSVIPVLNIANCLCCAWVIGGGILAANLYVKGSPEAVTLGRGLALGLLTGAIGAVVYILFNIPLQLIMRSFVGAEGLSQIEKMLERIPELPPEGRDALRSLRGAGMFLAIFAGLLALIVFSIMGMIGGVIGVAMFERRKPGQGGPGAPGSNQQPSDYFPPAPPLPPAE